MPENDIALDKASFVSLWIETLFFGAYAVLFCICIYILLHPRRKPGSSTNLPMLLTAVAMFSMSTAHVSIGLYRGLGAFISSENIEEGALLFYARIWEWHSIFKQALYATNNIVADGLVVYRCYIVWGYNWKIIVFPIVMLLASTICGYAAVYEFSQIKPGQDVFATSIAQWGTALFSISLATNLIVTGLIAGRIWWLARQASHTLGRKHGAKYGAAVAIVIESGAIYSVSLMILLILYCSETNAQYIVYDALAQIMGIVPTLIIVRVGLGVSTQAPVTTINSKVNTYNYNPTSSSNGVRMDVRRVIHVDHEDDFAPATDKGVKFDDSSATTV